jgi:hypothetical protein
MARRSRASLVVTLAAAIAVGAACQSPEEKARVEFSARLKDPRLLSREEIVRFYDEIGRAIAGKHMRAKQGAVTRDLDERQKAAVLGMLSDPTLVGDRGVRTEDKRTLRGLDAGATPPTSEIDAAQTLWIDVDTFIPIRYEFAYSMPGLGDYAYDIIVEP